MYVLCALIRLSNLKVTAQLRPSIHRLLFSSHREERTFDTHTSIALSLVLASDHSDHTVRTNQHGRQCGDIYRKSNNNSSSNNVDSINNLKRTTRTLSNTYQSAIPGTRYVLSARRRLFCTHPQVSPNSRLVACFQRARSPLRIRHTLCSPGRIRRVSINKRLHHFFPPLQSSSRCVTKSS